MPTDLLPIRMVAVTGMFALALTWAGGTLARAADEPAAREQSGETPAAPTPVFGVYVQGRCSLAPLGTFEKLEKAVDAAYARRVAKGAAIVVAESSGETPAQVSERVRSAFDQVRWAVYARTCSRSEWRKLDAAYNYKDALAAAAQLRADGVRAELVFLPAAVKVTDSCPIGTGPRGGT